MDNLTHSLVGATLARAGLAKRTTLGTATLILGANFPDIDVLSLPLGGGVNFRRGTTHGFLALAILPFVLAGIMWAWDRWISRRFSPESPPADYRQLAILSAVSIATHPTLDFMNEYGMRWLMPFKNQWFYADGLYIVDVWILVGLWLAIVGARVAKSERPARIGLVALAAYILANLGLTSVGRGRVAETLHGQPFMVSPSGPPQTFRPWLREVLVDDDSTYRFGVYSPFTGLDMSEPSMTKGNRGAEVEAAKRTPEGQRFLKWSRFPFYRVVREGGGTTVRMADARYMGDDGRGWAAIEVRLP